jgi:hypothetical protein
MKSYIKIFLTIILLITAYLIFKDLSPSAKNYNTMSEMIDTKDAQYIKIKSKNTTTVEFEKQDGLWWMISPYRIQANNDEIKKFLIRISSVTLFGPLTKNPELYERFGIVDSSTELIIKSTDELKIIIGKQTEDYSGSFIKLNNSDAVYEANGLFIYDVERDTYGFISKKIIDTKETETTNIKINYKGKEYLFSKTQDRWIDTNGKKIFDILNSISFYSINGTEQIKSYDIKITVSSISKTQVLNIKKINNGAIIYLDGYNFMVDNTNFKKLNRLIEIIN